MGRHSRAMGVENQGRGVKRRQGGVKRQWRGVQGKDEALKGDKISLKRDRSVFTTPFNASPSPLTHSYCLSSPFNASPYPLNPSPSPYKASSQSINKTSISSKSSANRAQRRTDHHNDLVFRQQGGGHQGAMTG